MLVLFFAVQACLWAHAATLVQGAAGSGEQAAIVVGGTPSAGEHEAQAVLTATASEVVKNPSVIVRALPGDVIEVQVTGTAESIIPWLRLPVSATRVGVRQEFRESG